MLKRSGLFLVGAALSVAACAPGFQGSRLPTPAEIPALEAQLARDSASVPALVRLGVAYRESDRLADARRVLERATSLQPTNPAAVFYLGLTYEDLDLPARARELYTSYLDIGNSPELTSRLRNRIPLLERQELQLAVQSALAREAELATTPPEPRTVAVFPFLYQGQNAELRPLSRALAEMLVTDLSQTNRMQVLGRTGVQMLLDELALSESGLVDPATAVRGGRLLRAESIVQGQLAGDEQLLRLQAAVVGSTGGGASRQVTDQDALRQLFAMQKRLSLSIYSSLGIELAAAERERVMQRPTENLEALLAYGECLEAEDAGDFARAASHCSRAATLDPGFTAARERAGRASAIASAMQESTAELGTLGAWLAATPAVNAVELSLDAIQVLVPDPTTRAPVAEATGSQGIGTSSGTDLKILIRRP